jgi:4-diphosphocytidyl-2-C-methyl-D-erythritol kinase
MHTKMPINTQTKTFFAPAKINHFLHVVGQRADGYHLLQTVFQFLDHYDEITLTTNKNGVVTRDTPIENVLEADDLCIKAAMALKKVSGTKMGVTIHLNKKIPMGGGLGGGSSDAATVLIALNQMWQLHLNRTQLIQIGLTLGADVPVFIFGQMAWAEGIGEDLTAISAELNSHYVVLTPKVNVPTAQIFKHTGLTRDTKPLKIADFSNSALSKCFKNDLETVVCKEFSAVAETLEWLSQFGVAKMSGSGASVFVGVNSKEEAENILQQKPVNVTGFAAKGLKYHPHFELMT